MGPGETSGAKIKFSQWKKANDSKRSVPAGWMQSGIPKPKLGALQSLSMEVALEKGADNSPQS